MRISGANRIGEIYKSQAMKLESTKVMQKDEVQLSNLAKDYQYAFKAVQEVPDVRQSKVDDIKARLKSGTYNVDAKEVVEKIISQIDMKG